MMVQIDMNDETGTVIEETQQLVSKLLSFALEKEAVQEDIELSLTFLSDEEIHQINKQYRHVDAPTDVISFALEEIGEGEIVIEGAEMPVVLGDILISIPTAEKQAAKYGHSFERELGFLAVHGLLHLLGYDHMNEVEEKRMFRRQEEILTAFGLER